jgi:hypothetical protein
MKPVRALLLSLGLLQLTACSHTPATRPDRVEQETVLPGKADIRPALLVGDNQFNFYFTDPIVLRNKAADYISHVAIRPPQLDIFADDLFAWALDTHARDKYVIHLGDATNIACVAEWERFAGVMDAAQKTSGMKGWVMLPGNHDAYLYGVTGGGWRNAPFNNVGEQWAKACSKQWPIHNAGLNPDWRLTKNRLLDFYFAAVQAQGVRHPEDFSLREVPAGERTDQYRRAESKDIEGYTVKVLEPANPGPAAEASFVQKVVYFRHAPPDSVATDPYDNAPEHRSFMVQLLNLSAKTPGKKTYALLIDTVDYSAVPVNIRGGICTTFFDSRCGINAGLTGMVSQDQQHVVKKIMAEIPAQGAHIILMGHHPLARVGKESCKCDSGLDKSTQDWLTDQLNNENVMGYISAHTHSGYVQGERPNALECEPLNKCDFSFGRKEINVGSVTDWPMEMRTLENCKPEGGSGDGVIHSRLIRLGGNDLPTGEACKAVHNYTASGHPYLAYYKGNWQPTTALIEHEKTLDTILVTYTRLFEDLITPPGNDAIDHLSAMAKETLADRCTEAGQAEDWLANSEACRARKRNLALCMEQVDEWLQSQHSEAMEVNRLEACSKHRGLLKPDAEYAKNRRNYGVCQAVWASQAEYLYTHTERNVVRGLVE